ncbi:VOC family protein [Flexivirga oryzae]|uniref:Catechol 2,3-dioxygenase-like lactoylglutathione lyase family enzyme n=1 Tax=Flexivirga oryzae TaxID=1794944 RepID=A0A839NAZ6_9MICO|nr:VOC family protein [Flexivirga oryzae]MBB2894387.1 catechol 2,3-dioxygenase-like lactoylglutathione lyase family enzyme [Flexivirga oryzae]
MATWFSYEYSTDIAATRHFYGELVGLEQVWDTADDIAFVHDCVQLTFHRVDSVEQPDDWAHQPGWADGQLPDAPATRPVRSVSIALPPAAFRDAVARLRAAGVKTLRPEPFWVGYWSFVVQDPNRLTVELTDPNSPPP